MPVKLHSKNIIVFIVGPTAVGKTCLAIKLAACVGAEVISCDSMQIYRGMRILSQAPSLTERRGVKHHLIGVLDPRKEYSAASFRSKASRIIKSVTERKRIPIVVGGSGLYAKALIDGLFPSPEADLKFRKKMEAFISKYGNKRLYKRLQKIDPPAASKIHPNDSRRIIRALEIYHLTGRTMSELKTETKGLNDLYRIKVFGLTKSRDEIYTAIDRRVDEMFESGAVSEVRKLKNRRLSKTARAALGFREIEGYISGEYDIETAASLMKRNTRHFAKRQLTWFRADRRIKWFDVSRMTDEEIVKIIIKEGM